MPGSLCGCRKTKNECSWSGCHILQALDFNEEPYFFTSSCDSIKLYVAIYPDRRRIFEAYGKEILEEPWDPQAERFTFEEDDMVTLKATKSMKDNPAERPVYDTPWTNAGKQNYQMQNIFT
ncbi:hypothetical protein FRC07_009086 [Ceratobasidium sp. 392]|nr:hypothetical protein FRC07_009086 [Ceratobasidium sp. 392]